MSAVTNAQGLKAAKRPLQKISESCFTQSKRTAKLTALYLIILTLGVAAAVASYYYFRPLAFSHPAYESGAVSGMPQVGEEYGFSVLTVEEDYNIHLCGLPANDGQTLDLYLTNPEENGVWFRAEILDENGNLLASTGVLRQGEHLPSVTLDQPLTQQETPITVRIVAYEPYTWQSRGNVNLNLTVYLNYT